MAAAAAHLSVSLEQCTCLLCKEVLKEPVTIPCGHSYCMGCINDYWDKSDNEGGYSCPQCYKTFIVKPELNRNAVFAELIENVKEVTSNGGTSQSYAGPADVLCDVCPGRKRKASKTCLTCMVSYCETHMLPHRAFPAYKRHKVEKEAGNLEEKLCTKHHRVLEIFCRTNKCCICLLCAATEHKYHETVTPEEERAGRQNYLEYTKHGVEKKIEEKKKKLEEMKEMGLRVQRSAERDVQEHEKTFESLQLLKPEITNLIRDYELKELSKTEELIQGLMKEIEVLKRRDAEMAELLRTDDHIRFLQKFPSLCVALEDGAAPTITVNTDFLPETMKKNLHDLKKHLEEMSSWVCLKTSEIDGLGVPK